MRLIDADYLKQKFCTHCEGYADCSATDIENRECYDFVLIDHTPTIEAIPVEWIDQYIADDTNGRQIELLQVSMMLRRWKEEHEIG